MEFRFRCVRAVSSPYQYQFVATAPVARRQRPFWSPRRRQEWIAFKADDQKRWTNYSLSQEETIRESDREVTKINDRVSSLEDSTQDLIDLVNAINDETEKRIKGLLSLANESLSTFEKTISKKS